MREVESHDYVDATQIITRIDSLTLVEFAALLLLLLCREYSAVFALCTVCHLPLESLELTVE